MSSAHNNHRRLMSVKQRRDDSQYKTERKLDKSLKSISKNLELKFEIVNQRKSQVSLRNKHHNLMVEETLLEVKRQDSQQRDIAQVKVFEKNKSIEKKRKLIQQKYETIKTFKQEQKEDLFQSSGNAKQDILSKETEKKWKLIDRI